MMREKIIEIYYKWTNGEDYAENLADEIMELFSEYVDKALDHYYTRDEIENCSS